MSGEGLVDPNYAGDGAYGRVIAEIKEAGVCPFCPENFDWHENPIEDRTSGWLITASMKPYVNARNHFLIIPREHLTDIAAVTEMDWQQILWLIAQVRAKCGFEGGALTCRFGPTNYTGATVRHLHFHLIQPEIDPATDRAKTVVFPIG